MKKKLDSGFTLIEGVIAGALLFIVVVGGLGYQYHAARQKRMAWAEMTALRTSQMVIEDWKSTGGKDIGGTDGYDPSFYDNDFVYQNSEIWKITIEDLPMEVKLESEVVETNAASGTQLKQLKVTAQWRTDFSDGSIDNGSPSVVLTTYVRTDT